MKLNRMPTIPQFRDVIKAVQLQARYEGIDDNGEPIYNNNKLPVLNAHGTCKLHGTYAGVSFNKGELYCQSKKNVITVENDNAGFSFFVEQRKELFLDTIQYIKNVYNINTDENIITIMGEFTGKGIQSKVAVSQLDKKLFIFGIKIKPLDEELDSYWVGFNFLSTGKLNNKDIFLITQFKTFEVEIDFNEPLMSQNKMVELVAEVEKECPVGKSFGVSGLGEGIVFTFEYKGNIHRFKYKGEKHAGKSKVKSIKKFDNAKLQKIIDLVETLTPIWRLEQAYTDTFDIINGGTASIEGTGDFLRAVHKDIMKEEMDLIIESGIEPKELNGRISKEARNWFMSRLDSDLGL